MSDVKDKTDVDLVAQTGRTFAREVLAMLRERIPKGWSGFADGSDHYIWHEMGRLTAKFDGDLRLQLETYLESHHHALEVTRHSYGIVLAEYIKREAEAAIKREFTPQ